MLVVETTAMAAGGDALGREPSGRIVFVEGALPGERVEVEVVSAKKDFAKSRVVRVLEASPWRVAEAGECGGCSWSFLALDGQAALKRDVVIDALRRIAHVDPSVVAPSVPQVGSGRTTVRLAVDEDGRAGFRKRHSHEIVRHDCPIVHPALRPLLDERFEGDEVTLRTSLTTGAHLVVGPADQEMHEDVADRRWQVSALSFFQPSPEAAALLIDTVRAAVGPVDSVVDAYAGVGLLGGSVGASEVVAIESSSWSAADAVVNLAGLDAVVIEGEVAEVSGLERPDAVIADPARPGLGPSAAAALASLEAPVLVLVSCDPASFARDVALLAGHGYALESSQVVDLFPQTFHVEVVSRLVRSR